MKLLDLHIQNFGKLSDFTLKFKDGINTVEEDNGYGKTTLSVFIKSMFYGLDDTKSQKLDKNSRKRYMPWQGGTFGGSLSFETEGREYRIERTFAERASEDTFRLYELKTGKESTDFTSDIGEELFLIDADGFERTIFLSEANLSGKNENKTVSAKLSDLVGYDGDLSDMDKAIKLLEKKRKIYHRKGGSGEIGDIKREISRLDYEINDLARLKETLSEEEAGVKALAEKINAASTEKALLEAEAKRLGEARVKEAFFREYLNMKAAEEKEKKALCELALFFKNGVPTPEEIETARENTVKAKGILSNDTKETSTEFDTLASFFSEKASGEEFDRARTLLSKIEEQKTSCEHIRYRAESIRATLKQSLPKSDEISLHIDAVSKEKESHNANKGGHTFLLLSLLILILGLLLGILLKPILLLLSLLAIPPFYLSSKSGKSNGKVYTGRGATQEAERLVSQYSSLIFDGEGSLLEKLYHLRSLAKEEEEKADEIKMLSDKLNCEEETLSSYIDGALNFVLRFQPSTRESVTADLGSILAKRDLYLALLSAKSLEIKQKEKDYLLATELLNLGNAFLSRYPTQTDKPFDEISAKLIEYSALLRSTELARARAFDFAREHNVDTEAPVFNPEAERQNREKLIAIEESITELLREKALADRQLNLLYEKISKIDDLLSERDALSEREGEYQRELDTVLMTQKMLAKAKDSLTSKYLSKTQSAFDKYITLISGFSKEDFRMDTSFEISKNEHGITKNAEEYSRGERDLFALATRLALVDSLYERETPFIILDDPFAYFDDARLKASLSAIKDIAKEKQIIYLTCTSARKI